MTTNEQVRANAIAAAKWEGCRVGIKYERERIAKKLTALIFDERRTVEEERVYAELLADLSTDNEPWPERGEDDGGV